MAPRVRAAAVLLAVVLVAGCGDDDDAGADASSSTTTTEAANGGEATSSTTTTAGSDGTSASTPSTTRTGGTDDPDDPGDPDDPDDPEEAGEAPDVLTEANSGDTYRLAERRIISLRLSNPPTWGEPAVEGDAVSVQFQPYEVDPGFTEYVISADEPGRSVVRFTGDRDVVLTFDVYEN